MCRSISVLFLVPFMTQISTRGPRRQTPDRHSTTVNTDRHPDNNNSTVKEVPTVEVFTVLYVNLRIRSLTEPHRAVHAGVSNDTWLHTEARHTSLRNANRVGGVQQASPAVAINEPRAVDSKTEALKAC